jgi:large subunit ribosomal protein L19
MALKLSIGSRKNMNNLSELVEAPLNPNIPELSPGDSVGVFVKIKEGDRERIQEFKGTLIAIRRKNSHETFTVRRIASNGIGVERTFMMRSPRIDKVVVERHGKVRRAKLFYLRERTGKKARLKEKFS